jgi:hypothetical protein
MKNIKTPSKIVGCTVMLPIMLCEESGMGEMYQNRKNKIPECARAGICISNFLRDKKQKVQLLLPEAKTPPMKEQ